MSAKNSKNHIPKGIIVEIKQTIIKGKQLDSPMSLLLKINKIEKFIKENKCVFCGSDEIEVELHDLNVCTDCIDKLALTDKLETVKVLDSEDSAETLKS